ncbi:MAG: diguanylate cyclase, partial [Methanobacterium paludis]|nr:diguanylate cyclase [Methanobacterium paludis]
MDFAKWTRILNLYLWSCILIIFLCEGFIFLAKYFLVGFPASDLPLSSYPVKYIFVPAVLNVLIMITSTVLIRLVIRRDFPQLQAFILITTTLCLCFVIVSVHYVVSSIYFVFCLPIMLSMFYIDVKPLLYASVSSLLSYWGFCLFVLPYRPHNQLADQDFMSIVVTTTVLIILSILAFVVLTCLSELVNLIIAKNIQAKQDSLTKLLNHASFYERLDHLMETRRLDDAVLTLIIFDLDGFK